MMADSWGLMGKAIRAQEGLSAPVCAVCVGEMIPDTDSALERSLNSSKSKGCGWEMFFSVKFGFVPPLVVT